MSSKRKKAVTYRLDLTGTHSTAVRYCIIVVLQIIIECTEYTLYSID